MEKNDVEAAISSTLLATPNFSSRLELVSKLGQGSFSTVVLVRSKEMKQHQFALKCLVPTTSSHKAASELIILQKLGGKANVIKLLCTFRKDDRIFFMMDYFPHDHFTTFVNDASDGEIQDYMKNLLIALRHVHRHGIIHRDVKATNFLFNRKLRKYRLIDFGLAEQMENISLSKRSLEEDTNTENVQCGDVKKYRLTPFSGCDNVKCKRLLGSATNHVESNVATTALPSNGWSLHSKDATFVSSPSYDVSVQPDNATKAPSVENAAGHVKSVVITCAGIVTAGQHRNKLSAALNVAANFAPTPGDAKPSAEFATAAPPTCKSAYEMGVAMPKSVKRALFHIKNRDDVTKSNKTSSACNCYGKPLLCKLCKGRKHQRTNKAGTAGFRAPEILLNHAHQTTAIDVWSAGVLFLGLLTRRYPFMKPKDDETALAQLITIFGTSSVVDLAKKLGKKIICQPLCNRMDFGRLVGSFRRGNNSQLLDLTKSGQNSCCAKQFSSSTKFCVCQSDAATLRLKGRYRAFDGLAVDLLEKMLNIDPTSRVNAFDALESIFFAQIFDATLVAA